MRSPSPSPCEARAGRGLGRGVRSIESPRSFEIPSPHFSACLPRYFVLPACRVAVLRGAGSRPVRRLTGGRRQVVGRGNRPRAWWYQDAPLLPGPVWCPYGSFARRAARQRITAYYLCALRCSAPHPEFQCWPVSSHFDESLLQGRHRRLSNADRASPTRGSFAFDHPFREVRIVAVSQDADGDRNC